MKKALVIIIFINWVLSICGLSIDTEQSSFWAVLLMFVWFAVSCKLLKYADKLITDIQKSNA
jgi:hypothetical protein